MTLSRECRFCGGKCKIEHHSHAVVCNDCGVRVLFKKAMSKPLAKIAAEWNSVRVVSVVQPLELVQ